MLLAFPMENSEVGFYDISLFLLSVGCYILPTVVILWVNHLPAVEFLGCLQFRASTKRAATNSPVQVSV